MNSLLTYIDLFAGAGGLSEGFIRTGFKPLAHIEMDKYATETIKTRLAYHYLKEKGELDCYFSYLKNEISKEQLRTIIPNEINNSVILEEISAKTINNIFSQIDKLIDTQCVDLIIGGPPCQAYSHVGRSRDPKRMKYDKRNYLFRYYGEFLKKYIPKFFVFENVMGLLTAGNKKYLNEMISLFSDLGYSTDFKILNAKNYGVLQNRLRVIIIGQRSKTGFNFPDIYNVENRWKTMKDLFYDLPILRPGQVMNICRYEKPINEYLQTAQIRNGLDFTTQHISRKHNSRDLEIYSIAIEKWKSEKKRLDYSQLPKRLQTHKNVKAFLDRYKVVDPGGLSHTIVAHISQDGHYYIYPDSEQVRSISVREAARLQSFPDDYFF